MATETEASKLRTHSHQDLNQFPSRQQNIVSPLLTSGRVWNYQFYSHYSMWVYMVNLPMNSECTQLQCSLQECHVCLFTVTRCLGQILIVQQFHCNSIDALNPSYFPTPLTPHLVLVLFPVAPTAHFICTQMLPVIWYQAR